MGDTAYQSVFDCSLLRSILIFLLKFSLLPQFAMSRVYTMTVLYTLLGRRELRDMFQGSTLLVRVVLGLQ
jgi:hypothetical protein